MAAVAAVAGMIAGSAVASLAAPGLVVAGGFGAALIRGVTSMAVSQIVGNAIGANDPPKLPDYSAAAYAARGILLNQASTVEPINVVYGRRRVGGARVFVESSGASNQYLHIVIVLGEGEISSIGTVYLDDVATSDSKFSGLVTVERYVGTDDQAASSALTAACPTWTSNHRLRGCAYVYVKLTYDANVFTQMPTITADVDGRLVYDPRSETTGWSRNPALVIRDYLVNARYGRGLSDDAIDDASFIVAANHCDELVSVPDGAGGTTTQARYTCDGVAMTDRSPLENLREMLTSCRGYLVFTGGKYRLKCDAAGVASFDFTEDNITGNWSIKLPEKRGRANRVRATFINPDRSWQPDLAIQESSTYRSADNGILLEAALDLPYTTDIYRAQQLAQMALKTSRKQTMVEFTATIAALRVEVGDLVTVTHSTPGWDDKIFRVMRMELRPNDEIAITAVEYDAAIYSLDALVQVSATPGTNLPDPGTVPTPTGLAVDSVASIANDGAAVNGLEVTWTEAASAFVVGYEVQWIRGSSFVDDGSVADAASTSEDDGSIASSAGDAVDDGSVTESVSTGDPDYNSRTTTTPFLAIRPVEPGQTYTVRVRSISSIGIRSEWVSDSSVPQGDTTAPGLAAVLTATGGFRQITLTWANPTDSDFDSMQVFRNTTNNSATATQIGVARGSMFVDAGLAVNTTYYYWLRSVDRTGNVSGFSSVASGTTEFIDSDDFSSEVMSLFAEAGAYGIEPVSSLPASGDFDGQIKYLTTDQTLYRWDAGAVAWTTAIYTESTVDPGTITASSFAAGIEPVSVVSSLPSASGYTGPKLVYVTADGKIYRYASGAWTTAIAAGDVTGTLAAANFASDLRPVEIVGTLPTADNFQGRTVILTTDNKLYRYTGTAWTAAVAAGDISGAITAGQIQSVTAEQITSQIVAGQIAANAVTAGKIAANAVTSDKIDANAITSGKIAAGAVTTDALAANAVTAGKITAGAIGADAIAANAISATHIAAEAITTSKIAAGSITAGLIAASGVITTAAQISDGIITNAKIANAAITNAKIDSVDASKIIATELAAISANLGTVTAGIAQNAAGTSYLDLDAVGSDPFLVSGSGVNIRADGTFVLGSVSKNLSWNGSAMTLTGDVVATGNIQSGAVTNFNYTSNSTALSITSTAWVEIGSLTMNVTTANGAASQPFEVSVTVQISRNTSAFDQDHAIKFKVTAGAATVYEQPGYNVLPTSWGPTLIWEWQRDLVTTFLAGTTSVTFRVYAALQAAPSPYASSNLIQRTFFQLTGREMKK